MGQPVVHFEIIGADPERLRNYYGELFGWEFDTSGGVAESVSEAGNYGFVQSPDGAGIPGWRRRRHRLSQPSLVLRRRA